MENRGHKVFVVNIVQKVVDGLRRVVLKQLQLNRSDIRNELDGRIDSTIENFASF